MQIMCDGIGIILRDVLYALNIHTNLVSLSKLDAKIYKFRFSNSKGTIGRNNKVIIKGARVDEMHQLMNKISISYFKYFSISDVNDLFLWHLKLAHISKNDIIKMSREGLLTNIENDNFDPCEPFVKSEMVKSLLNIYESLIIY